MAPPEQLKEASSMVGINEALQYMGIDCVDAQIKANIKRALDTAVSVLKGAVGQDVDVYFAEDPRRNELVLMYTDDLYSERGARAKVSGATRKLAADMELQLRLELNKAREAKADGV